MSFGWTFEWFPGWKGISSKAFEELWHSAFQDSAVTNASPFAHPLLFQAWSESYGKREFEPIGYIAKHTDGRIVLQVLKHPKTGSHLLTQQVLRTVGYDLFDYTEPLVFPGASNKTTIGVAFWDALWAVFETDAAAIGLPRPDVLDVPRVRGSMLHSAHDSKTTEMSPFVRLQNYATPEGLPERTQGWLSQAIAAALEAPV